MAFIQREVTLSARRRGCHLVTDEIARAIPELQDFAVGIAHIFIKHTSASLTVNENCDSDVRADMETTMNRLVPDDTSLYRHTCEGPDDMPAHVKASLMGSSVTLPVTRGRFNLGTWQGIYLNEHRNRGSARTVVITVQGSREGSPDPAASGAAGRRGKRR